MGKAKRTRWLAAGILAIALPGVIGWALFVPAADWLAHHDAGSVTGAPLETARTNARGAILTLSAGLVAAAALLFTSRNFTLSRRTFELTEQGQVTERYTKAIEQLGSDKLDVRIGGIYALERVARDSARDHPTVMEVLGAFIREHSRDAWPESAFQAGVAGVTERSTRADIMAALAVVGRRSVERDIQPVDLSRAKLTGADLNGANLARVRLTYADLTGADLRGANLIRARLIGADLNRADLFDVDFTGANLADANLAGADLRAANLTDAKLTGAKFTDANLMDTKWPVAASVPEGWLPDSSSRRLKAIPARPDRG